jgi:tape measure domain-containing protein
MTNNGVEYILSLKDLFTSKIKAATGETEKLNGAVGKTQASFGMLKTAISGIAAGYVINEVVHTTAAFEGLRNQLNFASGSIQKGGEDLDWIREKANYLGLDLQTAAQSFAKFSGAARGTSLEGQGVKNVFEGVAMAATVMHLSADEANGTFMALQQMLSKGKVSAEELNGQLGERLPGALGIAARSMNMTQAELMKMMQSGQLLSEDFLPKFAQQLKTEFAGGVDSARESLTANLNLMNNSFLELKVTVGELFMPVIKGTIQLMQGLVNVGTSVISVMNEHKKLFAFIGGVLGTLGTALLLYKSYLIITTAAQWALNTATAFFEGLTGVGLFAVAAAGAAALAVGIYAASEAQKTLNSELKAQKSASQAMNPLAAQSKQPTQTSTATAKGGTPTTAVESRGVQNFNISINKLIENLEFKTTNIKESGEVLKAEVAKALLEAVNDFQLLATK